MSPELAVDIVDAHYRYRLKKLTSPIRTHIIFYGGEPTAQPESIFAVMQYVKSNQIECLPHLLTNGIIKEEILKELLKFEMLFQVSFDGINNNLRLSKNGSDHVIDHTIKTIEKLSNHNKRIHIRATIHKENVANMVEIIEFFKDYAIESISFTPTFTDGNAAKYNIQGPEIDEYIKNLRAARDVARKLNIHLKIPELKLLESSAPKTIRPPLVWLPDGSLALTIKYASSRFAAARHAIVGRYDSATKEILVDHNKIAGFNNNFETNRQHYCQTCPISQTCQGVECLDDLMLNLDNKDQNYYFCEILRQIRTIGNER